ncbi:conserved Plasmodium protein, unknown function [Plasmodium ovale curtisi]|uniref:HTH OST-type domain-containing protein n=1 Tax=Plasmodium ovale curtisi TaxID=864141 RepID=A0A1A8VY65_PLAOA|nr:conserved Plasmodium protein, unknown function [Plasmodium ovale curtisi]
MFFDDNLEKRSKDASYGDTFKEDRDMGNFSKCEQKNKQYMDAERTCKLKYKSGDMGGSGSIGNRHQESYNANDENPSSANFHTYKHENMLNIEERKIPSQSVIYSGSSINGATQICPFGIDENTNKRNDTYFEDANENGKCSVPMYETPSGVSNVDSRNAQRGNPIQRSFYIHPSDKNGRKNTFMENKNDGKSFICTEDDDVLNLSGGKFASGRTGTYLYSKENNLYVEAVSTVGCMRMEGNNKEKNFPMEAAKGTIVSNPLLEITPSDMSPFSSDITVPVNSLENQKGKRFFMKGNRQNDSQGLYSKKNISLERENFEYTNKKKKYRNIIYNNMFKENNGKVTCLKRDSLSNALNEYIVGGKFIYGTNKLTQRQYRNDGAKLYGKTKWQGIAASGVVAVGNPSSTYNTYGAYSAYGTYGGNSAYPPSSRTIEPTYTRNYRGNDGRGFFAKVTDADFVQCASDMRAAEDVCGYVGIKKKPKKGKIDNLGGVGEVGDVVSIGNVGDTNGSPKVYNALETFSSINNGKVTNKKKKNNKNFSLNLCSACLNIDDEIYVRQIKEIIERDINLSEEDSCVISELRKSSVYNSYIFSNIKGVGSFRRGGLTWTVYYNNNEHSVSKNVKHIPINYDKLEKEREYTNMNSSCNDNEFTYIDLIKRNIFCNDKYIIEPTIENTWLKKVLLIIKKESLDLDAFFFKLKYYFYKSVLFLYQEGIKSYLGDVANQMKIYINYNFWSASEIAYILRQLTNLCNIQIEVRVKGEIGCVIYLNKEPPNFKGFVDSHDLRDTFSKKDWLLLHEFAIGMMRYKGEKSPTGENITTEEKSLRGEKTINREDVPFSETEAMMEKYNPTGNRSYEALEGSNESCMSSSKSRGDGNSECIFCSSSNKKLKSYMFNGGRYAFAAKLKQEIKHFQSKRLGEIIHLVQLAIHKGVFVYSQRILLPVSACEKSADDLYPKIKNYNYEICNTLDEVMKIISLLVDHKPNGLVLAQLKQQFILQFKKELNSLHFGYKKLQNLLLSEPFNKYYKLYIPNCNLHRTHIQHKKYRTPENCRMFKKENANLTNNLQIIQHHELYNPYDSDSTKGDDMEEEIVIGEGEGNGVIGEDDGEGHGEADVHTNVTDDVGHFPECENSKKYVQKGNKNGCEKSNKESTTYRNDYTLLYGRNERETHNGVEVTHKENKTTYTCGDNVSTKREITRREKRAKRKIELSYCNIDILPRFIQECVKNIFENNKEHVFELGETQNDLTNFPHGGEDNPECGSDVYLTILSKKAQMGDTSPIQKLQPNEREEAIRNNCVNMGRCQGSECSEEGKGSKGSEYDGSNLVNYVYHINFDGKDAYAEKFLEIEKIFKSAEESNYALGEKVYGDDMLGEKLDGDDAKYNIWNVHFKRYHLASRGGTASATLATVSPILNIYALIKKFKSKKSSYVTFLGQEGNRVGSADRDMLHANYSKRESFENINEKNHLNEEDFTREVTHESDDHLPYYTLNLGDAKKGDMGCRGRNDYFGKRSFPHMAYKKNIEKMKNQHPSLLSHNNVGKMYPGCEKKIELNTVSWLPENTVFIHNIEEQNCEKELEPSDGLDMKDSASNQADAHLGDCTDHVDSASMRREKKKQLSDIIESPWGKQPNNHENIEKGINAQWCYNQSGTFTYGEGKEYHLGSKIHGESTKDPTINTYTNMSYHSGFDGDYLKNANGKNHSDSAIDFCENINTGKVNKIDTMRRGKGGNGSCKTTRENEVAKEKSGSILTSSFTEDFRPILGTCNRVPPSPPRRNSTDLLYINSLRNGNQFVNKEPWYNGKKVEENDETKKSLAKDKNLVKNYIMSEKENSYLYEGVTNDAKMSNFKLSNKYNEKNNKISNNMFNMNNDNFYVEEGTYLRDENHFRKEERLLLNSYSEENATNLSGYNADNTEEIDCDNDNLINCINGNKYFNIDDPDDICQNENDGFYNNANGSNYLCTSSRRISKVHDDYPRNDIDIQDIPTSACFKKVNYINSDINDTYSDSGNNRNSTTTTANGGSAGAPAESTARSEGCNYYQNDQDIANEVGNNTLSANELSAGSTSACASVRRSVYSDVCVNTNINSVSPNDTSRSAQNSDRNSNVRLTNGIAEVACSQESGQETYNKSSEGRSNLSGMDQMGNCNHKSPLEKKTITHKYNEHDSELLKKGYTCVEKGTPSSYVTTLNSYTFENGYKKVDYGNKTLKKKNDTSGYCEFIGKLNSRKGSEEFGNYPFKSDECEGGNSSNIMGRGKNEGSNSVVKKNERYDQFYRNKNILKKGKYAQNSTFMNNAFGKNDLTFNSYLDKTYRMNLQRDSIENNHLPDAYSKKKDFTSTGTLLTKYSKIPDNGSAAHTYFPCQQYKARKSNLINVNNVDMYYVNSKNEKKYYHKKFMNNSETSKYVTNETGNMNKICRIKNIYSENFDNIYNPNEMPRGLNTSISFFPNGSYNDMPIPDEPAKFSTRIKGKKQLNTDRNFFGKYHFQGKRP